MSGELSLTGLVEVLQCDASAMKPGKMQDILERVFIPTAEIQSHTRFSDVSYARNLVHKTEEFEIMLMCWHAGQRSSIHDHAGSLGGLKILHGSLTESLFQKAPNGMIKSTAAQYRREILTDLYFRSRVPLLADITENGLRCCSR